MNSRDIEAAIQQLQDRLAECNHIPSYSFVVDQEDENSWSIESEYRDEQSNRNITTTECSGMFESELIPFIEDELFHNISARHAPKVPLSDRKDLYVIRTLFFMGEDQEYGYWMDTNNDSLTIGLRNDHNSAHIFEEKDKVLAERICELLNKSQHEHYYEVVSFYDAWRCL